MLIKSLTNSPEKIYVTVKASGAITNGQVVSWAATGTDDGLLALAADAAQDSGLVVGVADRAIASGDLGVVQVYGVHDEAIILPQGTASNDSITIGDQLKHSSAITGLAYVAAVADGVTPAPFAALETKASGTAATTAKVFVRCL